MPIQTFPKVLYREDGAIVKVASQAEQDALGATFSELPTVIKRGLVRVPCLATEYLALAVNPKRKTVKCINDSAAITRLLYSEIYPSGISLTQYTWILDPGERWEMPLVSGRPEWTGLITAITELQTGGLTIFETVFD